MIASWLVATHYRPKLLRAALLSIRANTYPRGWTAEIVVAYHTRDTEALAICRDADAVAVDTRQLTGGGKRTAGLRRCTGDLVLVADDDDIQAPGRATAAIEAFGKGHSISELREFRYLHLSSGAVVRWCGNGAIPVVVGTARNYRRSMLERVGGWKPLPRLIEKDIQARISHRFPGNLGRAVSLTMFDKSLPDATICLQHDTNVWDDRPVVAKGTTQKRGPYRLLGEGPWREISDFPPAVAGYLGLS